RHPRRDAQRVGLRACLARRPPRRAQPGPAAIPLARRPYDLRHAALSLWLNATGEPAEVAARAGDSARVLYEVYLHCIDGQDDIVSERIEDALDAGTGTTHSHQAGKRAVIRTVGTTPDSVRYMYVNGPRPAHSPRPPGPPGPQHRTQ